MNFASSARQISTRRLVSRFSFHAAIGSRVGSSSIDGLRRSISFMSALGAMISERPVPSSPTGQIPSMGLPWVRNLKVNGPRQCGHHPVSDQAESAP
jgi:hypothetical protein